MARKPVDDPDEEDFATFQQRYRAEEAARGGRGTINGQPSDIVGRTTPVPSAVSTGTGLPYVTGASPETMDAILASRLRENPPPIAMTPGAPSNPDLVMRNAENISRNTKVAQDDHAETVKNSYRSFLADQGINPDTIGNSDLVTNKDGSRSLDVPTVKEEYDSMNMQNYLNGLDNRDKIAARRLEDRNPGAAAQIRNDIAVSSLARGGRSSEDKRSVALQYLQQQAERAALEQQLREQQTLQSNGFKSGIGPNRFWDKVANIA